MAKPLKIQNVVSTSIRGLNDTTRLWGQTNYDPFHLCFADIFWIIFS